MTGNELIHRLLAEYCEIWAAGLNLELLHVRKLADLTKPHRREKLEWMQLMAMWQREIVELLLLALLVGHEKIHAGWPTTATRN